MDVATLKSCNFLAVNSFQLNQPTGIITQPGKYIFISENLSICVFVYKSKNKTSAVAQCKQCKQWRNFLSFLHLFAILSILSMRPSHWFYKLNSSPAFQFLLLLTRSLGPERGTVVEWHFSHKKITDFVPISTKRYNILIRYTQRLYPPHSQLPWFKRCCCFSPICVHSMHTYLSLWCRLKKDFFLLRPCSAKAGEFYEQ